MMLNKFEVAKILGKKESTAIKIIRILNKELSEKGMSTVKGRISLKYFKERFNI